MSSMNSLSNSISVIIPVLREGDRINELITDIHARSNGHPHEIIVVDGDPAGGTIRRIEDRAVIVAHAKQGRASQMNHGASLATGGILLFLHADTMLPPDAFTLIRNALVDPRVVGGCFNLGIDSGRILFRVTERYVALRTKLTRVPFGDQAIFIRKAYFENLEGYRDIPIMEDVDLMQRIRKQGGRICILPQRVMTSARRWETEGIMYATLRNWSLQILYCLGMPPEKLARFYRS
jgi:rSAM/selenodomain-associated transferase 2